MDLFYVKEGEGDRVIYPGYTYHNKEMTENLEFQEKVKEASPEEQYKIYYEHGKILQK